MSGSLQVLILGPGTLGARVIRSNRQAEEKTSCQGLTQAVLQPIRVISQLDYAPSLIVC